MHTIIKPRRGLAQLDLAEVWQARELLGFLAWRDIVVRYKQTSIGVLWAFIRPFLTMIIFTVVFGRIAKLPSDHVPYAVLTFSALLRGRQQLHCHIPSDLLDARTVRRHHDRTLLRP